MSLFSLGINILLNICCPDEEEATFELILNSLILKLNAVLLDVSHNKLLYVETLSTNISDNLSITNGSNKLIENSVAVLNGATEEVSTISKINVFLSLLQIDNQNFDTSYL